MRVSRDPDLEGGSGCIEPITYDECELMSLPVARCGRDGWSTCVRAALPPWLWIILIVSDQRVVVKNL
jgi:hypothetical protein